jgi:RNase P/RNase MRP subunit p29
VESKGKDNARVVTMAVSRELEPVAKKKDPKDTKADAGPSDENTPPTPQREDVSFPAGKTVLTSLEAFEPLKSKRTFNDVDAERLKSMGLDKPERSLVITTGTGKVLELEIGESSYGGQGRYARVKGQTAVQLLEPAVSTGFEGGPDSLMEKRVVLASQEDIAGYTARFGDKEMNLVQLDREQQAKRKVVPKDDLTSTSEAPGKLLTTLRNLRVTKAADPKIAGSAVASFSIDAPGYPPEKFDLLERTDGEGHLIKSGPWLFEITETQGKELLDDLAALWL